MEPLLPWPTPGGDENPLKSTSPEAWRKEAFWALSEFFDDTAAFPLTAIVRKDKMGDVYLTTTPKGAQVIDVGLILSVVMGQFVVFLRENGISSGEIWIDRMGSSAEEERLQAGFQELMESFPDSALPEKNKLIAQRVNSVIKFLDSTTEPMIQIADFVSGVIWAAAEGDNAFLLDLLEYYAPGRWKTYGIVVLEK